MKAFFRSHARALVPIDTRSFRSALLRLLILNLALFAAFLVGSELIRAFGYHHQQAYLCLAIGLAVLAIGIYQTRRQETSRRIAWHYPELSEKTARGHETLNALLYLWPVLNFFYLAWLARRHRPEARPAFWVRHPLLFGLSLAFLAFARWAFLIEACFDPSSAQLASHMSAPTARAFGVTTDVRLVKIVSGISRGQELTGWLKLQNSSDFIAGYRKALADPSLDYLEFLALGAGASDYSPARRAPSSLERQRYRNTLWNIETNLSTEHFWVARRHATLGSAFLPGSLFDSSINGLASIGMELSPLIEESSDISGDSKRSRDIYPANKQAFLEGAPGRHVAAYEASWLKAFIR